MLDNQARESLLGWELVNSHVGSRVFSKYTKTIIIQYAPTEQATEEEKDLL